MPIKTSSGKWKWGNVERSSKKELVQTVYGIWKKNGSKGSFSDFLKGTHESYEPLYTLVEAHEIHSYPEKLQPTLERVVKDNEDYELDHAYFNKEGKFIWMRNSKGYFHVFKPVKFVKTPGMTKPFGFKDLILKDDGMLEEVDRLRFVNGNEGLAYLSKKYHLDLKTVR